MKKIIIILLFGFVFSTQANNWRSAGGNINFCAYTFDGEYYLLLSYKVLYSSDSYSLTNNPIMKIKFSDESSLKLIGQIVTTFSTIHSSSTHHQIYNKTEISNLTENEHIVMFRVTLEQINLFKHGVEMIIINTIPNVLKCNKWIGRKTFGQKLYEDFQKLKTDFE